MKGLRINTLLLLGVGSILFFMVVAVTVYEISSGRSSRGFIHVMDGDIAIVNNVALAEVHMLEARRDEKDFLLRKDKKYLASHGEKSNGIVEHMKTVQEIASHQGMPELSGEAAQVIELIKTYRASFADLVKKQEKMGLDHKSGLRGKFRDAAHSLAVDMADHDVDDLLIALLQVRRYEKDYLRSIDNFNQKEKYKGKLSQALKEYETLLTKSSCEPEAKKIQLEALVEYKKAIELWMTAISDTERDNQYQIMRNATHEMEKAINGVRVSGAKAMLLNIRKEEKDFLLRGDKKYVTQAHEAIDTLRQAAQTETIDPEHTQAIHEQLDAYKKAFDELVATSDEVAANKVAMRDAVHQTEPILEKLYQSALKEAKTSTTSIVDRSASMANKARLLGVLAVLASLAAGYFIRRNILATLGNEPVVMNEHVAKIAEGDLTDKIPVQGRETEGKLAVSLNQMVVNLERMFRKIKGESQTLAKTSATMGQLSNTMADGAEDVFNRSGSVAVSAEEMSSNMSAVAAAMEQSSTNMSIVADTIKEFSSTIEEIARNSNKAMDISNQAVGETGRASESVSALGMAAQEINKVTEAINDIADQTNLLALNATIEAARAGEAGKGFAVVANEIKDLAKQTTESTREIQQRIEDVQQSTDKTVSVIDAITSAVSDMSSIVTTIASAVEEQSAASKEIAENVMQAFEGMKEVNENIAQASTVNDGVARDIALVKESVDTLTESCVEVREFAHNIEGIAGTLNSSVNQFQLSDN